MPVTPRVVVAVLVAVASAAGCHAQGGPSPISAGTYAAMASSEGKVPPGTELTVGAEGTTFELSGSSVGMSGHAGSDEYLLCPPAGYGTGVTLDGPVTIAGKTFSAPMVFGDCGATTPYRLTIVDLSTKAPPASRAATVPFSQWMEFCLRTDPDCPG